MLLTYLGRRLALAVVALFGVVLTAFLVAHSVPADPLAMVLSEQATKDPSIRAAYIKRWGLDRSLPEQFVAYLANVLRGDLGESFTTRRPVLQDLKQFLPATIELSLAALAVAVCFGVPLGSGRRSATTGWPTTSPAPCRWSAPPRRSSGPGLIALYVFYYLLELAPGPGRLDSHQTMPPRVTGFLLVDSLAAGNWELFGAARSAPDSARPRPGLVHHGAHRAHHAVIAARGARGRLRAHRRDRRGSARASSSASTRCGTP